MEVLGYTENRYSGIPTIRRVMKEAGLNEPLFSDDRGSFSVVLPNSKTNKVYRDTDLSETEKELLVFPETSKTHQEIARHLGIATIAYVMNAYVNPMIEKGLVKMTIPGKSRSHKQRYVRVSQL